ncbi:M64 family metallopeptidase [Streptomyces sp. NBC_01092]|uniref:M64 family metallopeptidase n=1 Tax=Streptomyces sp. NBC_01092 TaxID=2903748 RepID=UPI00386B8696|nr:M64 family metallopeptidase [Streptomyces sp. NBC_01092]
MAASGAAAIPAPAASTSAAANAHSPSSADARTVEYFPDQHGEGRHRQVPVTVPQRIRQAQSAPAVPLGDTRVTALQRTGSADGRLDVVIIGDGYAAGQQADLEADARTTLDSIFQIEPYRSYRGLFNFWLVKAVSNQSGVSGDPTQDVVRDTAVSSYFYCDGVERLLCVDERKVDSYARKAPDSDVVFVIANSTKYGGAGYSGLTSTAGHTGIATMSSDNPSSYLIGAHELGHSIGLLGDEYQDGGGDRYPGPEPTEPNLTMQTAADMRYYRTKWYRWIGRSDPSGGTVDAYEGGGYHNKGIYRPTENSIMRSLSNNKFNLPGREAMIAGFYRHATLLTPGISTARTLGASTTLRVSLAPLLGDSLSDVRVHWYVDGVQVREALGRRAVTPSALGIDQGTHTVTAKAVDHTSALREPASRQAASSSVTWRIAAP